MEVQVAVIDDGINEKRYDIGELKYNIEITPALHIQQRSGYNPFLPSHGTICAAIIKKYSPDVILSSVKILNDNKKRGVKAQLVKGLEWCADNNIHLVNLSLGTVAYQDFEEIEIAVKKATNRGVVIISACNNRNIFTCPASLQEVIGVKCDFSETLTSQEYIYNSITTDGIQITAGSIHQLSKYTGEITTTSPCNSFAAPMITAIVSEMMKKNPGITFSSIQDELFQNASVISKNKRNQIINYYRCLKKDINIPLLAVYDYGNIGYREVKNKLYQSFRKDGYYAISVCQKSSEENKSSGVVSIESLLKNGVKYEQALKEIYNVFDPDIIIIYIDNCDMEKDFIPELEASLDIDIKILMSKEVNDKIIEHIYYHQESQCIVLSEKRLNTMECKKFILLNYTQESIVNNLYISILDLIR